MLADSQREQLKPILRTTQIIVGALAIGIVNFAAVATWIVLSSGNPPDDPPTLTRIAIGVTAVAFLASFIVTAFPNRPRRQPAASPEPADESQAIAASANAYQKLLIVRSAILEGAAFFALTSFMLERHIGGAVMAALLLLAILVRFPTMSALESWVEREVATSEQMRYLG